MTDTVESTTRSDQGSGGSARGAISAMRLPELQSLAAELGVTGTSKMRKSDLLDAIKERRGGAAPSARVGARRTAPVPAASASASIESTGPNGRTSSNGHTSSNGRASSTARAESTAQAESTERATTRSSSRR
ncbi:MAG: Rho termination factor N-terminal domain-containing protein, partial [Cellulomonas sp.]